MSPVVVRDYPRFGGESLSDRLLFVSPAFESVDASRVNRHRSGEQRDAGDRHDASRVEQQQTRGDREYSL